MLKINIDLIRLNEEEAAEELARRTVKNTRRKENKRKVNQTPKPCPSGGAFLLLVCKHIKKRREEKNYIN